MGSPSAIRAGSSPKTDAKGPASADSKTADRGAAFWAIETACSSESPPEGIGRARAGPVEDAGDPVTVDEHVGELQVAVDEHRCPRPECSLGNPAVARDEVGWKDPACDEPLALAVEV